MNRNLFDSLFSYRPRPDRKPLEDYFTQLIAFLFSLDAKLASEWIKAIWKESLTNPEDIRILTQYSLGDYGRADIALFWYENRTDKSVLIPTPGWIPTSA